MKKDKAKRFQGIKLELPQLVDVIQRGLEILGESNSIKISRERTTVTFGAPWVRGTSLEVSHKGETERDWVTSFQMERKEEQTLSSDRRVLVLGIKEGSKE